MESLSNPLLAEIALRLTLPDTTVIGMATLVAPSLAVAPSYLIRNRKDFVITSDFRSGFSTLATVTEERFETDLVLLRLSSRFDLNLAFDISDQFPSIGAEWQCLAFTQSETAGMILGGTVSGIGPPGEIALEPNGFHPAEQTSETAGAPIVIGSQLISILSVITPDDDTWLAIPVSQSRTTRRATDLVSGAFAPTRNNRNLETHQESASPTGSLAGGAF